MNPYKITFFGAGNLASVLCMELFRAGCTIEKIISETGVSASSLAKLCDSVGTTDVDVSEDTDIVIIAVPDHKIVNVIGKLSCSDKTIIVHTSGTTGLDVFEGKFSHTGVFYPLQTFSPGRKIDFKEVPVFIEASDSETEDFIRSVASGISNAVYSADQKSRSNIHLAAVLVSNFSNYLMTEGKIIAGKEGFGFDILVPLLKETINKAIENGPENSQTGPARRGDINTIEKHLDLLSFYPELRNIYRIMTDSIVKRYRR